MESCDHEACVRMLLLDQDGGMFIDFGEMRQTQQVIVPPSADFGSAQAHEAGHKTFRQMSFAGWPRT